MKAAEVLPHSTVYYSAFNKMKFGFSCRILAEGFWAVVIQAATFLRRESICINALKSCARRAEAVSNCCACSVKSYPRPSRPS